MSSSKGQQTFYAKQIMTENFPEQKELDNIVIYFHNEKRENITSFKCIQNVSFGIQSDMERIEKEENRKITTEFFGYYLSTNAFEQPRFISDNKNGTLILTSLNASGFKSYFFLNASFCSGHFLFKNYDIFREVSEKNIHEYCSSEDLNDMIYSLVGVPSLLQDVKDRMNFSFVILWLKIYRYYVRSLDNGCYMYSPCIVNLDYCTSFSTCINSNHYLCRFVIPFHCLNFILLNLLTFSIELF
jgi:hypothetical protein